ncbi:hypothetical protein Ahu01nite_007920 [Winogradskya humida]|uniref:YCII-related domain-containing protein n=1 Tax=Winogradskya humida TaxID=113566 RepID=A0ABQ3ZGJ2_9ACTN|nr:hypothetical protein Ahu01nite_007920 [Actinoplanes humidus]
MDPDECSAQGVEWAEADCQLVWVRDVLHDGEGPYGQFLDGVVFVVADDQDTVLTTAAQQRPDLTAVYH